MVSRLGTRQQHAAGFFLVVIRAACLRIQLCVSGSIE